jgi:predicted amidohydrolase
MANYWGIAMVQMDIVPGDTEANVSKMLAIGREACADFPWVNMICYSELVIPGFSAATWQQQAEPIPGPSTDRFAAFAKEFGVWVQPGSMFEAADGKIYNSAPVLGPDGSLVANHRKMFPWRPVEPSEPGDKFTVFDVPGVGRFGLCICYDFWFPETCRMLTWMGAEVILHPTMTPYPMGDPERIIARANAIQNQVYMVSVGGCGLHGGLGLAGQSCIVDPDGKLAEEMGVGEAITQTVIDLDKVVVAQEYGACAGLPVMKHLLEYDHKLPMYQEGNLKNGEFYKKRQMSCDFGPYVARRKITLP